MIIHPFKGILPLNGNQFCPPYDIMQDQSAMLGKENPDYIYNLMKEVNGSDYTNVINLAREMFKRGTLIRDKTSSLYVLDQSFKDLPRRSIICLIDMAQYLNRILPHESTIKSHKDDRKQFLKNSGIDFGTPLLVADSEILVPSILETIVEEFDDPVGGRATISRISQQSEIRSIQESLESSTFVIADGHHRMKSAYEVFTDYAKLINVRSLFNLDDFDPSIAGTEKSNSLSLSNPLTMNHRYKLVAITGNKDVRIEPYNRAISNIDGAGFTKFITYLNSKVNLIVNSKEDLNPPNGYKIVFNNLNNNHLIFTCDLKDQAVEGEMPISVFNKIIRDYFKFSDEDLNSGDYFAIRGHEKTLEFGRANGIGSVSHLQALTKF